MHIIVTEILPVAAKYGKNGNTQSVETLNTAVILPSITNEEEIEQGPGDAGAAAARSRSRTTRRHIQKGRTLMFWTNSESEIVEWLNRSDFTGEV
jgi:hypothetical protein